LSSRSPKRFARTFFVLTALLLTTSVGCWEQWSDTWFPQMKRQKAIQAFERVEYEGEAEGRDGAAFMPPDGTLPVDGEAPISMEDVALADAAANALVNPRAMSLESIENGRVQYERFCATCHGDEGLGDGPVSMTGELQGPFAAVLAISGPTSLARIRSDGHIYTTIRYGRRRMPSYQRIASEDRWDIINYLRYLNEQKGIGE
jgi:mono/diheme cytochrome c family protein